MLRDERVERHICFSIYGNAVALMFDGAHPSAYADELVVFTYLPASNGVFVVELLGS